MRPSVRGVVLVDGGVRSALAETEAETDPETDAAALEAVAERAEESGPDATYAEYDAMPVDDACVMDGLVLPPAAAPAPEPEPGAAAEDPDACGAAGANCAAGGGVVVGA